jgi:probable blue pigment (indigoidine) exporter
LPSVAVSSLGLLSPVTAVLLGWGLLGQAMTGVSLVVLASILAVQWAMSRAVLPAVR